MPPSASIPPHSSSATTTSSTTTTKIGYLFGHPISHSLSPLMQNFVFTHLRLPYTYTLHESLSIPSFLALSQQPSFYGAAVTMPHKIAIIPHLQHLTPEGSSIGAINTVFPIVNEQTGERELVGTNTDCIGIREALRRNVSEKVWEGARGGDALVIGGGGTCRAAVYALKTWVGVKRVFLLNRDRDEVEAVIRECTEKGFGDGLVWVESLEMVRLMPISPRVIVSAIPDFEPKTEGERMVRECLREIFERARSEDGAEWDLPEKGAILEMCYHPSPNTAIFRLAREKGWKVIPGTEAMIWQGFEQDRIWTGRSIEEMPVEGVKKAVAKALMHM